MALSPMVALQVKTESTATNLLHEVPSTTITKTSIGTTAAADLSTASTSINTIANATIATVTAAIKSNSITTPLSNCKSNTAFHIESDWREAAQEPVLLVRCKKTIAELHKTRFGSGSRGKCIKLGKEWFTPTEFEVHCGRSASKDWKRSIRFQGQSLLMLIEDGFLQMHATSCSCSACLHNEEAAGSIRLHRPFKRKKKENFLQTDEKILKRGIEINEASATSTVPLPMSDVGELAVVSNLMLGGDTQSSRRLTTHSMGPSSTSSPDLSLMSLPLDKAWQRMNEILVGLQRSVSQAHVLLAELRERTHQETQNLRQKLLQEKEEAITQAKIEAQFSNITKSAQGFMVQVKNDGNQSLSPIMMDSVLSSLPSLNEIPPVNGIQKKCVNCNRTSDFECSGCQNRAYCSSFCQRKDWPGHHGACGRSTSTQEEPLTTVSHTPSYIFMLSE